MRILIFKSFVEKQVGCSQTMHTTIGNNKLVPWVSLLLALLSERQTLVCSGHVCPNFLGVSNERVVGGEDARR